MIARLWASEQMDVCSWSVRGYVDLPRRSALDELIGWRLKKWRLLSRGPQ